MSQNNSISLRGLSKRFGKTWAVQDLNLEIPANSFVSLLGPSGCGKTTTLRMLAGLESPTEGEIYIGDRLVFSAKQGIDVPASERGIGFLFQSYALWPHMTVYQNIAFGLETLKWKKPRIRERVEEMCELLRLTEYMQRYPSELSGGQQQRVAIARTLATSPSILLMDEPLSNLDAKLRLDMRAELKRLHRTTQATFVYVTHDQTEAMALSTSICLMKMARLQQYAPPLEVYAKPANQFVADFVGNPSINFVRCERSGEVLTAGETQLCPAVREGTLPNGAVTLGIRPEHIVLDDASALRTKVVSSFPYGMETTVVVEGLGQTLRCVVFGSVDFQPGQEIGIRIQGDGVCFFDAQTQELCARGAIRMEK